MAVRNGGAGVVWLIVAAANGLVTIAYLAIAWAIWRGLRTSGQVLGNRLGLATAGIFFTCAVHHGNHFVHLLLPYADPGMHVGMAMRDAFDDPWLATWDLLTAAVGIWYWTLRSRFPALVRGPAVFEDLRLREATERTLRTSEERYRRIVETTDEGVLVADAGGRVTFANSRLSEMLGRSVDDLQGRRVADLVPPEDRDTVAEQLLAADRHGNREQYELRLRRADGRDLWVRVSASPLPDDSGAVVGRLAMLADVTEQRSLEHQVRQVQKLDAVGQLASGVAHDFNNLLTVIDGYATILLQQLDHSRPERRHVQHIHAAALRASALTRQLAAFARDQHVEPQMLSLNEVVSDVRGMLARLIPASVAVVMQPTPEPALVRADRGRIEQVVINLAVNARDAMPDGGLLSIGTSLVELGAADAERAGLPAGWNVMLTVSDTGVGMTPEVRARAAEPFFTTKEPGRGTGLGLATVYGIVRQAGGHLAIHSEPGVGTTVKVLLPQATEMRSATPAGMPAGPAAATGTETILLAEDDEEVRELVAGMLGAAGYTVVQARDGLEADSLLAVRSDIDMLVTDVIMPGLTGPQLVERLAAHDRQLPVLFTSAYTRGLITQDGLLDPAVGYLEKPFTPAALTSKVRAALDRGPRARDAAAPGVAPGPATG